MADRKPRSKKAKTNLITRRETARIADNDLMKDFITLATHIVIGYRFHGIEEDDAIQECALTCWTKINRFDPNAGKAFNYFTSVTLNHLRQCHKQNKAYERKTKRVIALAENGYWDKADKKVYNSN